MRVETCYTGEIDNYGYAFVPGSAKGVVLLDKRTKNLLDNLSSFHSGKDEQRLQLLLQNGLIRYCDTPPRSPALNKATIKSMSTWLHITNSCNLDCGYCYIVGKKDKQPMPLSVVKSYLDKLENTIRVHQLESVQIRIAGGEPTMQKKLVAYLAEEVRARFIEKGVRIQLILLTNGTLLNPWWIQLIKSHFMKLCISLDGMEEWHDLQRFFKNGLGSFGKVHQNINLCLEKGIKPNILTTITENNISGISQLGKYLIDSNLPFRLGVYRDNSGNFDGYESFIEKVLDALNDCYNYYACAIRERRATFNHQLADIHLNKRPHLRSCNIGYSGVTVDHAGNVFLCQAGMDRKPIGNLRDQSTLLQMAWSQETLPELREKNVLNYRNCHTCQWALACGGGCPIVNASVNGAADIASPYCKLIKTMIPRLIELKALQFIQKYVTLKNERR